MTYACLLCGQPTPFTARCRCSERPPMPSTDMDSGGRGTAALQAFETGEAAMAEARRRQLEGDGS